MGRNKSGGVHEDFTVPSKVAQEAYVRASKSVVETEFAQDMDVTRLTEAHGSSSKMSINVGDGGGSNASKTFPDVSSIGKS